MTDQRRRPPWAKTMLWKQKDPTRQTPTADLLHRLYHETNPVTKSVLIDIIGRRIDRA